MDVPRGPDVIHRIRVAAEWLDEGAIIEFELPRNLKCATCEGGGCDRCDRSGAISVRGRNELGEVVQVTLPRRSESNVESTSSGRAIVIRIPERGGIADDPALPRGLLLLSVVPADATDPGIRRIEPPRMPPVLTEQEAASPEQAEPAIVPQAADSGRPNRLVLVVAVLVVLWVLFLIFLRVTGRG